MVEGQDLFLLSLKLSAQLSGLEDTFTEGLVLSQSVHALKTVGHEKSKMVFFLTSQFGHLLFQIVVVLHDGVTLALESLVTIIVLSLELGGLEGETMGLSLDTVDLVSHILDRLRGFLVVVEQRAVEESLGLSLVHVLLEADFELIVKVINLLDQVHLHGLLLFDVLVSDLLLLSEESLVHCLQLSFFLFIDGVDHLLEFQSLCVVTS